MEEWSVDRLRHSRQRIVPESTTGPESPLKSLWILDDRLKMNTVPVFAESSVIFSPDGVLI